jgi:hypothetical protein
MEENMADTKTSQNSSIDRPRDKDGRFKDDMSSGKSSSGKSQAKSGGGRTKSKQPGDAAQSGASKSR